MRAGPIRCWCEWIFDAIFAYNKQLSSIILHRCCHLVAYAVPVAFCLPFLCILWTWRCTNAICELSEAQELWPLQVKISINWPGVRRGRPTCACVASERSAAVSALCRRLFSSASSINQWINKSINQSINQSVSQSVSSAINQSINQFIVIWQLEGWITITITKIAALTL